MYDPRADIALGATIHNFDVELSDTDREVYETLALRVARHPSESEEYLIARVIAYPSVASHFALSVSDRTLYLSIGEDQITGSVVRLLRSA